MGMVENEFLTLLRHYLDKPRHAGELKKMLPPKYGTSFNRLVKPLIKSGEIVRIRGGRYGLPDSMNLVIGKIMGHPDGYGFVIPDDRDVEDVFIGPRNFREAMHGDTVVCRVERTRPDGKRDGKVIRILERAYKSVTGIFESRGKGGVIIPTQKRVIHNFQVHPGKTLKAKGGEIVVGRIVTYPEAHDIPSAEVLEILGYPGEPDTEKGVILQEYGLPTSFPEKVEKNADKISEPAEQAFRGRVDLRNEWVVTIDGETAKDFDDAVSIKESAGGFELGVHIADVSNYVIPKTPLDTEGYKRGNSTYFPGSVIPMLPFRLSNEICSLNPNVPRLTLSAFMKFDPVGNMLEYRFADSVIKSRHRFTYTEVAKILEAPEEEKDAEKVKNLLMMKKLFLLLRKKRIEEGSLDFDLPEPFIVLDMKGEPENIIRAERNDAHRLIEEFMLSANRAAARFLSEDVSLYRVHAEPDSLKVNEFFEFAETLGYVSRGNPDDLHRRMQEIISAAEGKPEEKLLNFIMLRTMKQAQYSPTNIGHFGLAFEHYTHFTSPIRRYPDLIVHRLIKQKLRGEKSSEADEDYLSQAGVHCSQMERNSESAERAFVDFLKIRYMANREGEEFDGIISGVTSFGIFVELAGVYVEGLLRLTSLADDYYEYHEKKHALIGKRTAKSFRLGAPIRVKVNTVDMMKKEIDLVLPGSVPGIGKPRPAKKGKGKRPSSRGTRRKHK
ncbi:MAG: ribonuclease R [Nitrospinota bacterium]|nr:ribonuclease R [Nitrospinota bacterium]